MRSDRYHEIFVQKISIFCDTETSATLINKKNGRSRHTFGDADATPPWLGFNRKHFFFRCQAHQYLLEGTAALIRIESNIYSIRKDKRPVPKNPSPNPSPNPTANPDL